LFYAYDEFVARRCFSLSLRGLSWVQDGGREFIGDGKGFGAEIMKDGGFGVRE
jgi:hypothetical protein